MLTGETGELNWIYTLPQHTDSPCMGLSHGTSSGKDHAQRTNEMRANHKSSPVVSASHMKVKPTTKCKLKVAWVFPPMPHQPKHTSTTNQNKTRWMKDEWWTNMEVKQNGGQGMDVRWNDEQTDEVTLTNWWTNNQSKLPKPNCTHNHSLAQEIRFVQTK